MSKLRGPDGRIPDRLPDGRPAVSWERRWTEGALPLWVVATSGGIAVLFVLGIFFYGSYTGIGNALGYRGVQTIGIIFDYLR